MHLRAVTGVFFPAPAHLISPVSATAGTVPGVAPNDADANKISGIFALGAMHLEVRIFALGAMHLEVMCTLRSCVQLPGN